MKSSSLSPAALVSPENLEAITCPQYLPLARYEDQSSKNVAPPTSSGTSQFIADCRGTLSTAAEQDNPSERRVTWHNVAEKSVQRLFALLCEENNTAQFILMLRR
ncbi:hypothetical protein F2P81_023816 [Scophthalmus maximus]|uniref:Uncharacterized protein n=1 Tax=Scophthalmus maximus TaxID=52904 RepID=A0A6A4RL29_SCOMX|nr:hypothetical protein F2P81_023816 [Scophthalmus maximus]